VYSLLKRKNDCFEVVKMEKENVNMDRKTDSSIPNDSGKSSNKRKPNDEAVKDALKEIRIYTF
jgi:hypothetical protein